MHTYIHAHEKFDRERDFSDLSNKLLIVAIRTWLIQLLAHHNKSSVYENLVIVQRLSLIYPHTQNMVHYTHIHVRIYVLGNFNTSPACTHVHIHTCTHRDTDTRAYTQTHTHVHTHVYTHSQTNVHTRIHTHIHTHISLSTLTYTSVSLHTQV